MIGKMTTPKAPELQSDTKSKKLSTATTMMSLLPNSFVDFKDEEILEAERIQLENNYPSQQADEAQREQNP